MIIDLTNKKSYVAIKVAIFMTIKSESYESVVNYIHVTSNEEFFLMIKELFSEHILSYTKDDNVKIVEIANPYLKKKFQFYINRKDKIYNIL